MAHAQAFRSPESFLKKMRANLYFQGIPYFIDYLFIHFWILVGQPAN